jgi:LacI family transcriptional regulator
VAQVDDTPGSLVGADQRPAKATLADLARAAGVNKSTASRALRDDASIASDTRERIRRLATALQYEPNASARRLSHARTDIVALASHALSRGAGDSDPFLVELLGALVREASSRGLDVLVCHAEPGEDEMDVYRRVVVGRHADGFILMDIRPEDPRLELLRERGMPHVLFGRPELDLELALRYPYPWVEADNRAGARAGTTYLIGLGHRRVAFLGCGDTYIYEHDRLAGYRDALADAGIAFDLGLCTASGSTQDDGYRLTRELLERARPPTAIFAVSDVLAVGAMRAARDFGLSVGRSFPVMGFDGLGLGTFLTPTLTTLRQPIARVGSLLARLLAGRLAGHTAAHHILLRPDLIVRASTQEGRA